MLRLSENANLPFDLPFDKLTALRKPKGCVILIPRQYGVHIRLKVEG
jgi:hypothetical protein